MTGQLKGPRAVEADRPHAPTRYSGGYTHEEISRLSYNSMSSVHGIRPVPGGRVHLGRRAENRDGSIPDDNPVLEGVRSHVYSYGHRNPQGLVFDADGQLFAAEHGPSTNDEVNRIEAGGSYGWPEVAGRQDDRAYAYANWSARPLARKSSPCGSACPNQPSRSPHRLRRRLPALAGSGHADGIERAARERDRQPCLGHQLAQQRGGLGMGDGRLDPDADEASA